MDAKQRREQIRREMAERHEEAYKRKDDSGKFKTIFEQRLSADKRFKCTEGEHSLDFIPYRAGANDPHNAEGKFTFSLDVFVHRKVGINEDDYLCLNRNYHKKCPVCDYQIHLQKQGETEDAILKSLNPTRRCLYNVWSHDNSKEEAKGIVIWDVSQWAFDSNLEEQSKKKKGGGYICFSDPDDGKIVSFRRTGMGPMNTKYVAISFEDRDEPIPDEIMDQAMCLDALIHIPTYEEVEKAFFGAKNEEDKPRSSRKQPDEDAQEPKEEPAPPKRKTKEPEEEPEPPKRKRRTAEPEDVPEPEELDAKGPVCPNDFVFGEDFGDFDACDDCNVRKDCRAVKRGETKVPEPKEEAPAPPARRRRT